MTDNAVEDTILPPKVDEKDEQDDYPVAPGLEDEGLGENIVADIRP